MEKQSIKEEKLDTREDEVIDEENIFLSAPIKVEYPVANYEFEDNASPNVGSFNLTPELDLTYSERTCPIKQEKLVDDQGGGSLQTERRLTYSDGESGQSFHPALSIQGTYGRACSGLGEQVDTVLAAKKESIDGYEKYESTSSTCRDFPFEFVNTTAHIGAKEDASDSNLSCPLFLDPAATERPFSPTADGCDLKIHPNEFSVQPPLECVHSEDEPSPKEKSNGQLKKFKCDVCNKKFTLRSNLKVHQRIHRGEKPFQCDECKQSFFQRTHLVRHQRIHTGEKPFECDECKQRFSQKKSLENHQQTHSGDKPFQCDECKLRFSRKFTLQKHKMTHTGEKPFECEHCSQKFSLKNTLLIHQRVHTGEKRFQCDECGERFSHESTLRTHQRVHTGEKPFQCDICKQTFSLRHTLVNHVRVHTGERPYKCDMCGKTFTQLGHLKSHKIRHTGEKPYQCNLCMKAFSRKDNLLKHKNSHSKITN